MEGPEKKTVQFHLLDRESPVEFTGDSSFCLEQILVQLSRTEILKINPVSIHLFQFKQGTKWLLPSTSVQNLYEFQQTGAPLPSLRIRFKIPGSKSSGGTLSLRQVDPVAFRYMYIQIRKDLESGKLYSRRQSEKSGKGISGLLVSGGSKDKKDIEAQSNIMDLVARNMAIDITDNKIDKKEISSNIKSYIPRDLWTGVERFMAINVLKMKVEASVDKLLKGFMNTTGSNPQKEDFLRCTERYFPGYFHEEFSCVCEEGGRSYEVKLLVTHPKENEEARLIVKRRSDKDEEFFNSITISQICNIALKDIESGDIEISRMNGIPMYFRILHDETFALLTLLCGYYRLIEKWTFSLCSEIKYPTPEGSNKVHGPILKDFARSKLEKLHYKKGSYILRQSLDTHGRIYLMVCTEDKCPPEELCILKDKNTAQFSLQRGGGIKLEDDAYLPYSTIDELIKVLKQQKFFKLADCIHPSEFDRCHSLLLCRNPVQWRQDALGTRSSNTSDRFLILYNQLFKYEGIEHRGRMCMVWKGEWRRGNEKVEVAIKQLKNEYMDEMSTQFLNLASRSMRYDDPSICQVFGACLPIDTEPLILVREYFKFGPLDAFLRDHKQQLKDVELLEAGTSLARALFFLQEKGLVHRDIRCRNVYVAEYTDKVLKVKLCEGGLGAPRAEDVHWLDWHQLQSLISSGALLSYRHLNSSFECNGNSQLTGAMINLNGGFNPGVTGGCVIDTSSQKINCTLASDVWSFGTVLWEIFSKGSKPLPHVPLLEAARQYLSGDRLKWPMGQSLKQVETIMISCWRPLPDQRIKPQLIMRDLNQILYKVFNSRRPNDYVTIDDSKNTVTQTARTVVNADPPPPTPPLTSTLPAAQQQTSAGAATAANISSSSYTSSLVPVFKEVTGNLGFDFSSFGDTDSTSPLIGASSSSSSSIYNSDISALTCQTSIEWGGQYSLNSIYPLENDQIEYCTDAPLGVGNFGIVYKGVLTKSDGEWEQVAIKMIKDTDMLKGSVYDDMDREIKLMKRLSHDNIVKIRGYITGNTNTIIVMEYIKEGSLDRYLQLNRRRLDYPRQLFNYSQNIVDGMEYLAQNKIIHRDLAARNILVYDEETVKISDFGLARDVNNDYYVMQSTTNIPVKWLALECLLHSKYSHASDVWAFGVTLWEMFTFGQTPALDGCEDYFQDGAGYDKHREDLRSWIEQLQAGVRLPKTEFCPQNLYSRVMLNCWLPDPAQRPTFSQLKHLLKHAELEAT